MARKRFVTSDISTDRKIAKLAENTPTAAALWPWFLTAFDDWGRMNADPVEVKLTVFPAFPYTSDEIADIIQLYHEYEIAYYYEVDGKVYLAVNPDNWFKYQTYIRKEKVEKQKSKFPEPGGAPWEAKDDTKEALATKNVAKQHLATENVLSPSPSPSPLKDKRSSLQPDGSTTSNPSVFDEQSTEYQLASLLRSEILRNLPNARVPDDRPRDMASWCMHIDRMMRLDNRDPTEIAKVIEFAQRDPFWQTNILSTKKLREKYDQLLLQMRRKGEQNAVLQTGKAPPDNKYDRYNRVLKSSAASG